MLWPVLGDDGLSPTSPPPAASVKGVNKLAPFLLCAPCKPSQRKNQNSTQWYVQQPTWRLWGEERGDGVIYTVYLKKVRYHRPTRSLSASDSDDEISHLEWETVRVRFLKAGTVQRLVESLANDDGELESTYINVFLATYRAFTTPREVLELLLARYDALDENTGALTGEQHRKTLIQALHVWLDAYPGDWKTPPNHPLLARLLDFAHRRLPGSELELKARHRLHRFQREDQIDCVVYDNGRVHGSSDSNGDQWTSYTFPEVPQRHFAEQLTRMDAEVFKKLVAHQCLGAVWSRRDRSRNHEAATVLATVNQFNAVSLRVISTILTEPTMKSQDRARILEAWIDIAQELRVLKNFSSLKAIVSGLQSNPVYRLEKCWQSMPREKHELFRELERIFSEENNAWTQRELLIKEGTAKFADTAGRSDRHLQKLFQKQNTHAGNISYGTIPYLGTFLTDLTMIDTAIPDTIADGLINFDKRRKEFEVLARIRLLQGAANAYNFSTDPLFDRWFHSVVVLDDREAYKLSCQIEPPPPGNTLNSRGKKKQSHQGHRKNDSIASTSSSSSSQFYCDLDSLPSSPHNSLDRRTSPSQMSSSSSSSSLPSLDVSLSSGGGGGGAGVGAANRLAPPTGTSFTGNGSTPNLVGLSSPSHSHKNSPDFYIIKVTMESENVETDGVVLYKSIMLSNNERTPQVIRNAMLKLGIEGSPDQYTLAQVLPDREMVLPHSANVYYAVNTAHNLNFILRPKRDVNDSATESPKSKNSHNHKR
ncbi:ral guanine nucleotide dissociation stimulator-like isoform X1 [Vespa mandarinia]|uniref:ral guanine nucleotide dissociation stimulator-like isoform X1 n=1 Tax=Vespa mandarinia TaxID=7446 RepID=UPI001609C086|nr:ral guanine nucleotide dissociation stimulator-like isoform X1 [Vespa mandarinia]XP_046824456.1 ral guanine nucleotide dissociation stimulator isoform X1 [Vespa crabro]XP_046824457.1 ral guanine nucleotide dissociation stimulator isoform X1 [Vespa crabro]XP_046824458.1 ral guanine nucleotide dissociation stimulator isoform X1 [Vespa crabro]XP_046824459.1 ral guanine nucleotide dissociation stimulator isoform X1 [Vespa crabro]XP_046824460.1 ral guanine nucleotide dissociation stimulator isof